MIRFIKYVLKKTGLPPLLKRLTSVFKKRQPFGYDFIFGDITNTCNLKCPHCYNNWDEPFLSQTIFMSKKHFNKIIPLIPLAANHDYHLSCAFEPLLHPEFKELVSMIPFSLQKNVLFTTNLTTNITDGVLQFLSQTNLRYINISVESFMPDVYESCRKNGKFNRFIDNLERLAFYFDRNPKSPPIRFITLASKLNVSEIPSIIEKCSVAFHASEHEVRNFYITANNRQWVASHALTATEWDEMEKALLHIP
jgi:MoaA/NifB/PqqE/SkfB family radical SAM enzyme